MRSLFRPRSLLAALAGLFLLHAGYLYFQVGTGLARDAWDVPSILYGRPAVIRLGDPVDNLRLPERLRRLSYQKVPGVPESPGTWSEEQDRIRIHTRGFPGGDAPRPGVRATIGIAERRVASLETSSGPPLEELVLEPEEIARILGPKMESRRLVLLAAVPKHLHDAVLAAEDSRFYTHFGIDFVGVMRALMTNLRRMRIVQGGSTITQQLAKNFFLSPKRSIWRKIREAELAIIIEFRFSKEEIFQAYLNKIYFGQEGPRGIYGVEDAANFYFSKSVGELTLEEAALLAGIIRSPQRYSPLRMADAARNRRNWVLSRMAALGMISRREEDRARLTPLRTNPRRVPVGIAEYYVDYIERAAEESLGPGRLSRTGYRFYTSLDPGHQSAAEKAVAEGLAELGRRTIPAGGDREPLQAALVAVDPATGELTAMVGGRGYAETQFNRAADARRQPGSAFKPIVALSALSRHEGDDGFERPFTLASILEDRQLVVETVAGPWEPVNYDRRFRGPVTLRDALEHSLNVPFARLGMAVGPPRIVETGRGLGIESPLSPVPSLALGASEVSLLELTRAYGVLAAGGFRADLRPVLAVLNREGDVREQGGRSGEQVVDPAEAYLVTSALRGAVERGTGRALRALGYEGDVAAKSGTTNDFRDGWFIGYTPSLAVGVWVGFDDGRSIGLPGARVALPVFARFLAAAVGPRGDRGLYGGAAFSRPAGLEVVEVDPRTGLRAGPGCRGQLEYFLPGTAPAESCSPYWVLQRADRENESWVRRQLHSLRAEVARALERGLRVGRRRNQQP